jgi:hypothetical protein
LLDIALRSVSVALDFKKRQYGMLPGAAEAA